MNGFKHSAAFAIAVFGMLAVGTIVMTLVTSWLVDSAIGATGFYPTGASSGRQFFVAVLSAFTRTLQIGVLLAIVVGVYLAGSADARTAGAIRSAVATGVGAGATLVVLVGLVLMTAPGGASPDAVELLQAVVGVTAGTVVSAAGAGYATVALQEN